MEEAGRLQSMESLRVGTRLSDFTFTFHFHALEKEMATRSNVLAWRIPGTGEPGGPPSMGSHRVGHNWSDLAVADEKCSHFSQPSKNTFNYSKNVSSSIDICHSVTKSCLTLCDPHGLHHTRIPCPRVCSNSCPLSQWCHPTISSSVSPFCSRPESFPASGSFPMSQLYASGGQSIGVSPSTSVLSMNTQHWSPLEWTGWISLQSKGLSRIFSNTTVQKHQF